MSRHDVFIPPRFRRARRPSRVTPPKSDFELFFEGRWPAIFRLCAGLLGDAAEAEDAAQEAFLRLHRRFSDFQNDSGAAAWLWRVAMNLCMDSLRRRTMWGKVFFHPFSDREEEDVSPAETAPDPSPSQETAFEQKELAARLWETVARLKVKYSQVLILRELEGLSYEEIGRRLGITTEAVGVRIIRARNQLKSKMKRFL